MKINNKTSKLIKRLGITFVIPFLMLIFGVVLILSVGWNLIIDGVGIGSILFNKPTIPIAEKKYLINSSFMSRPHVGDEIGTLEIPDLNLKETIYHGESDSELRKGIGHFAGSTMMGEDGNIILSAHRHTFFKPLENIKVGSEVIITAQYGTFKYKVSEVKIVDKNDNYELRVLDHERLTMYTCYPFSLLSEDEKRMVIICDFIENT